MSFNDIPSAPDTPETTVTPPPTSPGPMMTGPIAPMPPLPTRNPWAPATDYRGPVAMMYQQYGSPDDRAFVMSLSPGRVAWKNQLSEYRTGQVIVGPSGVTLFGKALPSESTRTIVYLISLFTIGLLIGYLIIEYAMRQDKTDFLTWDCIEGVSYDRQRGRVCIAYHFPTNPKKSYALGLRLDNYSLDALLESLNRYAPGIAVETKILSSTSRGTWIFLGLLVAFIITIIVLVSSNP